MITARLTFDYSENESLISAIKQCDAAGLRVINAAGLRIFLVEEKSFWTNKIKIDVQREVADPMDDPRDEDQALEMLLEDWPKELEVDAIILHDKTHFAPASNLDE